MTNFIPFQFLKAIDLNTAFADTLSLSATDPQALASTLVVPEMEVIFNLQTQQFVCTGDALFASASAITIPVGTTFERPNQPTFGMLRANKDAGTIEVMLASGKWATLSTTDAVVTPSTPPVSMAGPQFGQTTSNAIPLGWSAPSGGTPPYTYKVEYRLAGTSIWNVWVQQTSTTSTTVSGLLPAARYEFQITAFNAAGSATSPVSATNTLGFLAGGPTNVTTSLPTSNTIALTWVPVSGVAAYQVEYALQGASTWTAFGGPTLNNHTTVTGLVSNSTYVFHVVAKTLGSSLESLVTTGATLQAATSSPNSASSVVTSGVSNGGFTVSWQPPSAGTQPLSYAVQYQLAGTSTWTTYGDATTSLSVTLSNLNSGSSYSIRVQSSNSAGSSFSTPISVTTLPAVATIGSVAGSQNSGPNYPVIQAPFDAAVSNGSALAITGIMLIDPAAVYSSGTLVLTVSCTSGHITLVNQNGGQIEGSGTNSISYASTLSAISAALGSLVYTATAVGDDTLTIKVADQLIQTSTLTIDVIVTAGTGTGGVTPPPGGGTTSSITATGQPTDGGGTLAKRTRSFLDGVGLNVRMEDVGYNQSYTQAQAAVLENMINYLGSGYVMNLREECGFNLNPTFMGQVAQNCGLAKYILTIGKNITPSSYQSVLNLEAQMATLYPNFVTALEGPFGADLSNNLPSAIQFQPTLYGEAHSLGLSAWQLAPSDPSLLTSINHPPADLGNVQVLPPFSPNGGSLGSPTVDTTGFLHSLIVDSLAATPSLPTAISSFGWQSFPDGLTSSGLGLVTETVQASYILEFLFSAYKLGAKYYLVKELLDVPVSLSIDDVGQSYGLFNASGIPKVSGVAIHNMYTWLGDTTAAATSFVPGKLNYTVTNKPGTTGGFVNTGYQEVLFQKSNGEFWLAMWNEQTLNTIGGNNAPLNVPPITVNLAFNEGQKSQVGIYDPIGATVPSLHSSVTSLPISLPAHPIFVQVVT